ncbi:SDR family oxidoreductase [Marinimicrobium sp. ABcell2]|uniref:SDR family oxidoreductase n=1 Tax=Marinimicrobium sp. ABcell2 TaxID=3069751 RepID=UPI0027B7EDC6|nr:SDR family oxidoreductase [Marinimicrobium sp. ABcell2]MDQ2075691.1 SDR family oxidoreductase [Marinimicrobium sp. ABcell2]
MGCVVITGANRGIGLELCRHYVKAGYEVYGACRKASKALGDSGANVIEGVDVSRAAGIGELARTLDGKSIDILINNAGVLKSQSLGDIDYADVERQFEVNAIGPLRVTESLLPNLRKGAKVALITSRMGSIADNTSGGSYGYRMSKAALNAAGMSLAHDLAPRGVSVAILHPGFVQTDMVGGAGDITPAVAAERLAQRIEDLSLETTGGFWHSNGERLPW